MRKNVMKIFVILGLAALTFCSVPTWADETTKSADFSVFSRYMWRGYTLSDEGYVMQPSVTFTSGGFSLNLWGNIDSATMLNETTMGKSDWNETDVTVSYDWSFDKLSFGLGGIYYYLDGGENTYEFYYTVSYDTILCPTLTFYKDMYATRGIYAQFGISHSIEITDGITLDLSGSISYYAARKLYEYDADGNAMDGTGNIGPAPLGHFTYPTKSYAALHDGTISASMTIPVYKELSVTPSVSYTTALSDKAKNHIKGMSVVRESDQIYGGITLSYTF